jgi:(R)-amidase
MENQDFAAYVNRTGRASARLNFIGESALIDPYGDLICETAAEPTVLSGSVDIASIAKARQDYCYLRDARISLGLSGSPAGSQARIVQA